MDGFKFGVLLAGLAGLVGCFLPLADHAGSLWDVHTADMAGTITVLGAFAAATLMGVLAIAKAPMLRWQALVALIAFAVVPIKLRGGYLDMIKTGGLGAKIIGIAPLAGALFAILAMVIAAPAVQRR